MRPIFTVCCTMLTAAVVHLPPINAHSLSSVIIGGESSKVTQARDAEVSDCSANSPCLIGSTPRTIFNGGLRSGDTNTYGIIVDTSQAWLTIGIQVLGTGGGFNVTFQSKSWVVLAGHVENEEISFGIIGGGLTPVPLYITGVQSGYTTGRVGVALGSTPIPMYLPEESSSPLVIIVCAAVLVVAVILAAVAGFYCYHRQIGGCCRRINDVTTPTQPRDNIYNTNPDAKIIIDKEKDVNGTGVASGRVHVGVDQAAVNFPVLAEQYLDCDLRFSGRKPANM